MVRFDEMNPHRSLQRENRDNQHIRSFGGELEPRYIFGAEPLDQ
jgi:hypothetical protein